MPFKKGKHPAIVVAEKSMRDLFEALFEAGYEEHNEQKMRRKNEIATFRKLFKVGKDNRQNHVQIVANPQEKSLQVYAHTEPSMSVTSVKEMITHGFAALVDNVCYPAGSRMLINDLKGVKKRLTVSR